MGNSGVMSSTLLSVIAALLLAPVAVLAVEIVAAIWGRRSVFSSAANPPSVAILIPAHNEEAGIPATLRSILPQLQVHDRLIVVADNCSDRTAAVAEAEGAEVVSRTDPHKRGKGFALDFGIQHLRSNPRSILIIVDADCEVAPRAISCLATLCANYQRPIQAQYLMRNQADARLKQRIAEFAWVVKNLVRPLGLANLGLPCQLMGSGMAFPWAVINSVDLANSHLVEDMKMGLDLARRGVAPIFCPDALVQSYFPTDDQGRKDQRTRWEHGHLGIIAREAPRALCQGLKTMDIALLALALDLCVPPLALLVMVVTLFVGVASILYLTSGYRAPLVIASCAFIALGVTVIAAWASHGRRIVSFSNLLSASFYPLLKIPMYVRFVFSRQREWIRSKRDNDRD